MKKSRIAVIIVSVAVITGVFWWLSNSENPSVRHAQRAQPRATLSTPNQTVQSSSNLKISKDYSQITLKGKTKDEAVAEYLRHVKNDSMYDWKVHVRFYGKVVDQHEQPVEKALIRIQLVNRQGLEGVEETMTTSNNKGQFSLEGVQGKRLLIWISREGFYDVSGKSRPTSFEFANPGENIFYEPDPNAPVIFHLQRKGKAETLIRKSIELTPLNDGSAVTVDLLSGSQSATGQLEIRTWKPQITAEQIRKGKVFPYDWRISLNIADGGFLEQHDAFPFEAPLSGYNPLIDISLHATNGASVGVSAQQDYYFCFGQPRKYGHLHFNTDGDRPLVFIDYYLNPQGGNRNLEYDPAK